MTLLVIPLQGRNKLVIESGFIRFPGLNGDDFGYKFSKLASASRTWQVSEFAAALAIRSFIFRESITSVGNFKETSVDREVHATAGREAGATISCTAGR